MGPEIAVHARIRGGKLEVGRGPLTHPDLIIEAGPGIRALMAREITPEEALRKKIVRVRGDKKLLTRFTEMFQI
ncbi:MAG: hypothetical protein JOZ59_03365 [Candidatus Eremiobacteraeota bacterium]|nr:hypothetical protein [Candidatus Eremiobacteraeota bacterium]